MPGGGWSSVVRSNGGNRVFPVSDSARDIVDAMTGMLKRERVRMVTGVTVLGLGAQRKDIGRSLRRFRSIQQTV